VSAFSAQAAPNTFSGKKPERRSAASLLAKRQPVGWGSVMDAWRIAGAQLRMRKDDAYAVVG
jgi:hypothetical protein